MCLITAIKTFLLFVVFSATDSLLMQDPLNYDDLSCSDDKKCIYLEECQDIVFLMYRNELPLHRFKQAICGYDGSKPKVCCGFGAITNYPDYSSYPGYPESTSTSLNQPTIDCNCGKSLIQSDLNTLGSYPFLARIGFINILTGETKYPCTGTILTNRTILTTASCVLTNAANYKLRNVLIGEYDISTDPDCNSLFCGHKAQKYDISYIIKYPTYDSENYQNNLALIRLKKSIDFTVTAQPICLLSNAINPGNNAILTGWGKFSRGKKSSDVQSGFSMTILPSAECRYFAEKGLCVDTCAIGNHEPCSGFNGSPLIHKHLDTYFLAGILSYGSKCETSMNHPTVFLSIPQYNSWIRENW
ncbi:phenoloxidase-activating enzyme 1-like [Prorops nasuta]|uniref:phenoloxidase-activating enzyme 1-like n=1 Tax=Prorops nasuta TaxID=863751 RepID=UPI0034CFF01D